MAVVIFKLSDGDKELLRDLAEQHGTSMSQALRQMIDCCTNLHNVVSSGATVLSLSANTTSGTVWLGKVF